MFKFENLDKVINEMVSNEPNKNSDDLQIIDKPIIPTPDEEDEKKLVIVDNSKKS